MKQENSNNENFYDSIFLNPDFKALFEAQQMQRQKKRVLLIFEYGLNRKDHFITTRTFPFYFSELPRLVKDLKKWKKVMHAVSHLFQYHKVIYFGFKRSAVLKSLSADAFFDNQFRKKSFKLKNFDPAAFSFFKINPVEGIVFQEYRFNVSRFFIEVLKYFVSEGGEILLQQVEKVSNQKVRFKNLSIEITASQISSSNQEFKSLLKIPVQPYKDFEVVVNKNNSFFRFSEVEKNVTAEAIDPAGQSVSKKKMIEIVSEYFTFDLDKAGYDQIFCPPLIEDIVNVTPELPSTFPCSFRHKNIDDNYELCLEKYDLAKQTGISFPEFKSFFHRYGAGVDEITETAYGKLNSKLSAAEVWKEAEMEYQERHEWLTRQV